MTSPTNRALDLRKLRRSVQKRCFLSFQLLIGQPGLSKADQMIRLDKVIETLEEALAKAKIAREFAGSRDFDAHLAAKAAAQAAQAAHDTIPDSAEKASEGADLRAADQPAGGDAFDAAGAEGSAAVLTG
jgi:hypothetical protein